MFVLERTVQEGFWIEGPILVRVLSVDRGRVALGIEAPGESELVREQLWSRPAAKRRADAAFLSLGSESVSGILPVSRRRS